MGRYMDKTTQSRRVELALPGRLLNDSPSGRRLPHANRACLGDLEADLRPAQTEHVPPLLARLQADLAGLNLDLLQPLANL